MVLLAPDTELEEDLSSVMEEHDGEPKAELDAEELTKDLPKEQQKVELDLEDAPFLEDDDDEDEEEDEEEEVLLEEPEPDGTPVWYKNRKIQIAAGAILLLLVGVIIGTLILKPEPEVTQPEVEQETLEAEEAIPPPPPEEPEPEEYLVTLDPFWVEQKGENDKIRFLVCQFTAVTQNEKLSFEISQKTTILRDAVFYYLKNKDLTFLSDKKNAEALKADVLSVVNQYLSVDRLETLLIEQYLVK
ncbi:flagellar basal body-associated FliL family protein [Desulfovibrio ferrophilus]|uniref:Flagellar protein FliL n=1 Tax=Desulfovibrio ferrophilus TaxID=241368 RepID=A0A2Z6AXJ7_9BACT|nr:flagellar basal body-associated FliL family protein [Desulfovibrio ferrophilus]BBD07977.1 flagellar basal body-associated protein [Desulfovibrio ferrophilus]